MRPFESSAGAIDPLPELYGLALFAQLMGVDARRVGVRVSSPGGVHLKVWAVRSRRRTSVLLINKGSRAASVSLPPARVGSRVQLERLSAPSISSRYGVRLAGRVIGSDGRWHGPKVTFTNTPSSTGTYRLRVVGYSSSLADFGREAPGGSGSHAAGRNAGSRAEWRGKSSIAAAAHRCEEILSRRSSKASSACIPASIWSVAALGGASVSVPSARSASA